MADVILVVGLAWSRRARELDRAERRRGPLDDDWRGHHSARWIAGPNTTSVEVTASGERLTSLAMTIETRGRRATTEAEIVSMLKHYPKGAGRAAQDRG
jgi:hypothetical protein